MLPRIPLLVLGSYLTGCASCPGWLPVWTPFCRAEEPSEARTLVELAEDAEAEHGCLSAEETAEALGVERSVNETPTDPARRVRFYGSVSTPTGEATGTLDAHVGSDDQIWANVFFSTSCQNDSGGSLNFPIRCAAEQAGSLFFSGKEEDLDYGIVLRLSSEGLTEEVFNLNRGDSSLWPGYAPGGLKSAGVNIPECF